MLGWRGGGGEEIVFLPWAPTLGFSTTAPSAIRRYQPPPLPLLFPFFSIALLRHESIGKEERQTDDAAGEGAEWWSGETVAVVTGANRGIGLEICRQLVGKGLTVIMTARKPREQLSSSAQQFLQEAAEMGRKNVIFHTLDTTQEQMIDWDFMKRNNIDTRTIVVHPTWTEGISEKYESAKDCIETNFYGTKRLTKALLPLLRPSSYKPRIINVSSNYGLSCHLRDEELRGQLCDTMGLTEQKVDGVLAMFLDAVKSEKGMEKWPLKFPSYSISKIALNAYTRLLALELGDKACVNSVHPGYVITDMTFGSGDLNPAEGAANLVHVALLPAGGPSGHNFLERKDADF